MVDHLEELRRRLFTCLGMLLAATLLAMTKVQAIIDWLKRPAGYRLPLLAFFSPGEALLAYVHVGVITGLVLSLPVVLWQIWSFVKPGLAEPERGAGLLLIFGGTGLFALGLAFAYSVALPMALAVLLSIGEGTLLPMISVSKYLSFTTGLLLAGGLIFEMPLAVAVLARFGVVTPQGLRRRWPLAVLAMAIGAALITPTTDAVTMMIMMAPMALLYGLSILIAARVSPRFPSRQHPA